MNAAVISKDYNNDSNKNYESSSSVQFFEQMIKKEIAQFGLLPQEWFVQIKKNFIYLTHRTHKEFQLMGSLIYSSKAKGYILDELMLIEPKDSLDSQK